MSILLHTKRTTPPKLTAVDVKAVLGEPGQSPGKPARINFLVSAVERDEIRQTAKMFGLTTTDYLPRLHRLTIAMMQLRSRRRVD